MKFEHVELLETALVQKHVYTFACGILATGMLLLDGFLAATKTSLFALGDQGFDLF